MTHQEYAESLRLIADFFERNLEIGLPIDVPDFCYFAAGNKKEMAILARALGTCDKIMGKAFENSFELHKQFGSLTFKAIANRGDVCERIVTGIEEVPEETEPAHVIAAHTREIVEWKCPESLLTQSAESVND